MSDDTITPEEQHAAPPTRVVGWVGGIVANPGTVQTTEGEAETWDTTFFCAGGAMITVRLPLDETALELFAGVTEALRSEIEAQDSGLHIASNGHDLAAEAKRADDLKGGPKK